MNTTRCFCDKRGYDALIAISVENGIIRVASVNIESMIMADKYEVKPFNGKFRVWNATQSKWADRIQYKTERKAARVANKLSK